MIITKKENGADTVELARKPIETIEAGRTVQMQCSNVDHLLAFKCGDENLTYELGSEPEDAGTIREDIEPGVEIFGAGKITLSHIAIFRDIHYTTSK